MALTLGIEEATFAKEVAAKTGLDPIVVVAWMVAEGANAKGGTGHHNLLNLRTKGGGTGYSGVKEGSSPGGFATFGSLDDAVKETAYWINTMQNYSGIRAARGGTPARQLDAIAASSWDAGHYGGTGVKNRLRTLYAGIVKGGSSGGGLFPGLGSFLTHLPGGNVLFGSGPGGVQGGIAYQKTPPDPIAGYIKQATKWAEVASLSALSYLILTVAAILLFVFGLERTLGPSPLTRGLPPGTNPVTSKIPF